MTNYLKEVLEYQLERYSVLLHNMNRDIKTIKNLSGAIDRNMEIYKKLSENPIHNKDKT